jgi:hypothetical protein
MIAAATADFSEGRTLHSMLGRGEIGLVTDLATEPFKAPYITTL